jgi:hypothetical protein
VKNNRDSKNIVFWTALQEHDDFIYDGTAFLLSMAIAGKALSDLNTLADLQEHPEDNALVLR